MKELLDGKRINLMMFKQNFIFKSLIDSGSFSHVLKAIDLKTNKLVAVKVIIPTIFVNFQDNQVGEAQWKKFKKVLGGRNHFEDAQTPEHRFL